MWCYNSLVTKFPYLFDQKLDFYVDLFFSFHLSMFYVFSNFLIKSTINKTHCVFSNLQRNYLIEVALVDM